MTETTFTEWRDVVQGSVEWHDLRRGTLTASAIGRLITTGAASPLTVACDTCGAEAENLCLSSARKTPTPIKTIHEARTAFVANQPPVHTVAFGDGFESMARTVAAERLSGLTESTPMSSDMRRGQEAEPYARTYYETHYGRVVESGFMVRQGDGWRLGYSPDGLVGDDGIIEIKSPRGANHLATVLDDEAPSRYMAQVQAGLLASGRAWCDYVSFSGGLPLYRKRIHPHPDWQGVLIGAARAFETRVEAIVSDFLERTADMPPTEPLPDPNDLGLVF